jgi:hypothetical protein
MQRMSNSLHSPTASILTLGQLIQTVNITNLPNWTTFTSVQMRAESLTSATASAAVVHLMFTRSRSTCHLASLPW